MKYEDFKRETLQAESTIQAARRILAVSEDFNEGFAKGMREAREIWIRLEDRDADE